MGQSQLRKSKKECLELMRNERFKESLEILENLEKSNLKNKSEVSEFVNFQRGLCYMALKQNREAIQCFEKCNSKQSKINIGLMKIKLDKLEEAKTYFENLIRDSKYQNNPYLLQLYGYCILVGDKDYHKSAQIFDFVLLQYERC
ncbi:tetratricopeptide repeat protein (macronuclear) [Tetrahymena thermophila SB210]|uniref:Tetratricopeptide repeat protein n=1 Tax=Tetrahymena thermophila (strain SB210) TaxID=312017 RepID=Q22R42_TETTS|nr:tetratricopeptide repeat protein [Tetrahymena thermophila SB210]EAR88280.2 tetratricopeptide repeat protein [Tetrahymena thermophila SB210]|eukprot:XP_001008525.2 tetratricopeptide repeat protein [Tetrahymena thermophila SB210]